MTNSWEGIVVRRAADRAWVHTTEGEILSSLRRSTVRVSGRLAVGDRVRVQEASPGTFVIAEVHPRKNFLPRPHLANIDQLLIVSAFREPALNVRLIDQLLVVGTASQLPCVLVFNKQEWANGQKEIAERYRSLGFRAVLTSAKEGEGISELREILMNHVSVLMGASGVGKTSLLRILDPTLDRPIGDLSVHGKHGRHTTTRTEIFFISTLPGCGVADTPGFDWLSLLPRTRQELLQTFPEFLHYSGECSFADCAHLVETGCAVRQALKEDKIWSSRYESYIKCVEEIQKRRKIWKKTG